MHPHIREHAHNLHEQHIPASAWPSLMHIVPLVKDSGAYANTTSSSMQSTPIKTQTRLHSSDLNYNEPHFETSFSSTSWNINANTNTNTNTKQTQRKVQILYKYKYKCKYTYFTNISIFYYYGKEKYFHLYQPIQLKCIQILIHATHIFQSNRLQCNF